MNDMESLTDSQTSELASRAGKEGYIMPRAEWKASSVSQAKDPKRLAHLSNAINHRLHHWQQQTIPIEWVEEYNDISERLPE